jgi:hypothetical protein
MIFGDVRAEDVDGIFAIEVFGVRGWHPTILRGQILYCNICPISGSGPDVLARGADANEGDREEQE